MNLLTNAIKFTKTAARREIHVRVSASADAPPPAADSPRWFPTHKEREITIDDNERDSVFVTFAVQDTGKGITSEEMERLFNRFAQANAKTHIQVS